MKRFIVLAPVLALLIAACSVVNPPTADPTRAAPAPVVQTVVVQQTVVVRETAVPQPTNVPVATSAPAATDKPLPTTAPYNPPAQPTTASSAPTNGSAPVQANATGSCAFPAPGNLDSMDKVLIEQFKPGVWTHRVYNVRDFHAPDWGGSDSWFVTLAIGANSGGSWTSFSNPGQIVYRGTSTRLAWCLGILTTAKYKEQAVGTQFPGAVNVRIAPNSPVTVKPASGVQPHGKDCQPVTGGVTCNTSDAGDITIVLKDSGVVTISVDYTTAAPTHESLVWWGPYDRSQDIDTIDAR